MVENRKLSHIVAKGFDTQVSKLFKFLKLGCLRKNLLIIHFLIKLLALKNIFILNIVKREGSIKSGVVVAKGDGKG